MSDDHINRHVYKPMKDRFARKLKVKIGMKRCARCCGQGSFCIYQKCMQSATSRKLCSHLTTTCAACLGSGKVIKYAKNAPKSRDEILTN